MVKQSDKPEFIQSFDTSLYPKISKDLGFKMFLRWCNPLMQAMDAQCRKLPPGHFALKKSTSKDLCLETDQEPLKNKPSTYSQLKAIQWVSCGLFS